MLWVVAIDGSEHALHAVTAAIRLMDRMPDGILHLLHVHPWLSKEAAETQLPARGWAATDGARTALDAAGLPWVLHVVMGEAAERIVNLAKEINAEGIIIGSRGLGAAENLLIGSVAYKVIHLSPLPVLVVR